MADGGVGLSDWEGYFQPQSAGVQPDFTDRAVSLNPGNWASMDGAGQPYPAASPPLGVNLHSVAKIKKAENWRRKFGSPGGGQKDTGVKLGG